MKWTDSEDIGIALDEKFPDVDPLTLRFTDLRQRVLELDGFSDDPHTSNEPNSRPSRWPGTRSGRSGSAARDKGQRTRGERRQGKGEGRGSAGAD